MRNHNVLIIITTLIVTVAVYIIATGADLTKLVRQYSPTRAAACDTSFFNINQPNGQTFSAGCLEANSQLYPTDNRYTIYRMPNYLTNATYIKTPNSEIMRNQNLTWSIDLNKATTVYIMSRHIPGVAAPDWIADDYQRVTNDTMNNVDQYLSRKNQSNLIGVYDIYSKEYPSGSVTFFGASDTTIAAYSMYVVALQPINSTNPTTPPNPTNPPGAPPTALPTRAPTSPPNNPTSPPTGPIPTNIPGSGSEKGYIVTTAELRQRKQLADQGQEPYRQGLAPLLSYANNMLNQNPSPQQPLNIPGTTGPYVDDTNAANALALAYGITGDARYAQKAKQIINAWVATTKSTSNTCPDGGGCQTSLIIGRVTPMFVFAADLIKSSGVWTSADDAAFKDWLRVVILPTASVRTNNWGDAGTQMRVIVTDYIGDQAGLNSAIAKFKSQVDLIAADGHIPEETRRGSGGITYSSGATGFRVAVAKVMERRGMDLWSYGRFKLSADFLAKYVLNPSAWPFFNNPGTNTHSWWELAYAKWREPSYVPVVKSKRPYGVYENSPLQFSTFTNGVPLP